ncbi:hypothetical protein CLOM_g6197 [Closterium sp. NIES-68]|nr:hypothetical protein CLOM_g6197 [Closterium sp. NIES-68]
MSEPPLPQLSRSAHIPPPFPLPFPPPSPLDPHPTLCTLFHLTPSLLHHLPSLTSLSLKLPIALSPHVYSHHVSPPTDTSQRPASSAGQLSSPSPYPFHCLSSLASLRLDLVPCREKEVRDVLRRVETIGTDQACSAAVATDPQQQQQQQQQNSRYLRHQDHVHHQQQQQQQHLHHEQQQLLLLRPDIFSGLHHSLLSLHLSSPLPLVPPPSLHSLSRLTTLVWHTPMLRPRTPSAATGRGGDGGARRSHSSSSSAGGGSGVFLGSGVSVGRGASIGGSGIIHINRASDSGGNGGEEGEDSSEFAWLNDRQQEGDGAPRLSLHSLLLSFPHLSHILLHDCPLVPPSLLLLSPHLTTLHLPLASSDPDQVIPHLSSLSSLSLGSLAVLQDCPPFPPSLLSLSICSTRLPSNESAATHTNTSSIIHARLYFPPTRSSFPYSSSSPSPLVLLSPHTWHLPNLCRLSMEGVALARHIPDHVCLFPNLRVLKLQRIGGRFGFTSKQGLGKLPNLTHFLGAHNRSHNKLLSLCPNILFIKAHKPAEYVTLTVLQSLRTLVIDHYHIQSCYLWSLSRFSSLHTLRITNLQVQPRGRPGRMTCPPSLTSLQLVNFQDRELPGALLQFSNIKRLDLIDCWKLEVLPVFLTRFENLIGLNIEGCVPNLPGHHDVGRFLQGKLCSNGELTRLGGIGPDMNDDW